MAACRMVPPRTGKPGAATFDRALRSGAACSAPLLGIVLWAHAAWAQAAGGQAPTEDIVVIGSTPLLGSGVDRDKVPGNTVVIRSGDLQRGGSASATRALNESASSVDLDQAVGNEFQPNLLFRGFEASPLAGDAQGVAVYLNGTRFNSSFADTTNWDVIPDLAIAELDLVGSNPAFGLNALGGGISVRLKDGFNAPGAQLEASGGSFGRIQLSGEYGLHTSNLSAYAAFTGANDDGWREHSPSQIRQGYVDFGWRDADNEIHLSVLDAVNNLVGNGTSPVELLAVDRAAVFTYPDETRNHYVRTILNGNFKLGPTESIQANAYYSYLDQLTYNGDAGEQDVCEDNPTQVCEDDGETPLTDRNGTAIPNAFSNSPYYTKYGLDDFAEGGPYSVLNVTQTRSNSFGSSAQLTSTRPLFGHQNHLVVGAGYDGGISDFSAETFLGGLSLERGYIPVPNIQIVQDDLSITPVAVHTTNDYYGVFATDTFDITKSLFLTLSGRFNHAEIDLHDQIGTALNGNHSFSRFNPAAGISYKIDPHLTVYGGYAESNRAPTPSELSCASPDAPCSLTNFFVGDPDLKQVVSHSYEAGLNAKYRISDGRLTGHAGFFRTDNDDDIQFVTSSTIGRAYFRNVGGTRRQGAEASLEYRNTVLNAFVSYTYTDATYRSALTFTNESNPNADDDGNYAVNPGNTLPGVPAHAVKFGVDGSITPQWRLGFTSNAASGQYLFGDEGNQSPRTGSYIVFNLNTSYAITDHIQLFANVKNVFGARYETYGTFAPTADVPIVQAPGASNPRALTPGAPIAGYGGVRMTF